MVPEAIGFAILIRWPLDIDSVPVSYCNAYSQLYKDHTQSLSDSPDSEVHGANMGHTWVLSASDRPHVGPMNIVIRVQMPTWQVQFGFGSELLKYGVSAVLICIILISPFYCFSIFFIFASKPNVFLWTGLFQWIVVAVADITTQLYSCVIDIIDIKSVVFMWYLNWCWLLCWLWVQIQWQISFTVQLMSITVLHTFANALNTVMAWLKWHHISIKISKVTSNLVVFWQLIQPYSKIYKSSVLLMICEESTNGSVLWKA